jgi:hypothetical protein
MTITDRDMKDKIADALGSEGTPESIEAVFDEIHRQYGLVDVDHVENFWKIVELALS